MYQNVLPSDVIFTVLDIYKCSQSDYLLDKSLFYLHTNSHTLKPGVVADVCFSYSFLSDFLHVVHDKKYVKSTSLNNKTIILSIK